METFIKRLLAIAMTVVVFAGCFGGMSFQAEAETLETLKVENTVQLDCEDCLDSDELLSGYLEKTLYENPCVDLCELRSGIGESRLETKESKSVYSALKKKFEKVAAGEITLTWITLDEEISWTASELGVDVITSQNVEKLVEKKFAERIDLGLILKYLMLDCPYELYWYDKTATTYMSYGIMYNSQKAIVSELTLQMPVEKEFQAGDTYVLDASVAREAEAIKAKILRIVEENEDKSNYEKLVAYKEIICDLATYDYDVESNDESTYGGTWQLLWVFDEDEDTKVVCEGYAKSFQYLCDLSGIACYTITGWLESEEEGGPHMWNIVTLGGKSYIVDLTNCDEGTIGYPDKLFLAGTQGSVSEGYVFPLDMTITFIYDDMEIVLFGEEILTLAEEKYVHVEDEDDKDIEEGGGFEEDEEQPKPSIPVAKVFADVKETDWFKDSVQYVYDNGIMSGNGGLFKPTGNITRAQVVTTLYNLAGKPKISDYKAVNEMIDVQAGQWYTDAVCWAYNVGVANGNSTTKMFNMNTPVTRQQLATFFYNYAEFKGLDTKTRGDISSMVGANQVASYALDTMRWAVGTGLITGSAKQVNGVTIYDLNPMGTATRAQVASILQRFCEKNNL